MFKKNIIRKIGIGLIAGLILTLFVSIPVLAAVGNVSNLSAVPSATSISLLWDKASGSTSTVIRYSATTFPADWTDGTSAYGGTSNNCIVSDLTAGTTYYFAAWGYDGADYSTTEETIVMTTKTAYDTGDDIPTPTLPAVAYQVPDSSAWLENFQPFTGAIIAFAEDWGMPQNNMLMSLYSVFIAGLAVLTYWKWRNVFMAFGVLMVLTVGGVFGLHLLPWWAIPVSVAVGLGVWATENAFQ
jgi:hypothetical protein